MDLHIVIAFSDKVELVDTRRFNDTIEDRKKAHSRINTLKKHLGLDYLRKTGRLKSRTYNNYEKHQTYPNVRLISRKVAFIQ